MCYYLYVRQLEVYDTAVLKSKMKLLFIIKYKNCVQCIFVLKVLTIPQNIVLSRSIRSKDIGYHSTMYNCHKVITKDPKAYILYFLKKLD